MIGQTISHYKIIKKLGEGSTGSVYLAEDEKGGESVVLKMLPGNLATASLNTKGFLEDAGSARALKHPNVGSVYGIEDSPEGACVVREFVPGKALSESKGPLPVETVLTIAREIAAGLKAAHENGMVHRDIETETIILTDEGHVKIMDFGVGKLSDNGRFGGPFTRIGSPAYLSPEQVEDGEAGEASDLWSLGVVLYELLTGELPFKGEPEAALLYEILNTPPGAISSFRSDVPGYLEKLVSCLLEKNPARRPGSATEVIERLEGGDTGEDIESTRGVSICVLYFENVSPDPGSEYISTGVSEAVIRKLSEVQGVNVVPRSDVLSFRGHDVETRQIGETIGVDYVLEGRVRRTDGKLRVTTGFMNVETGLVASRDHFACVLDDMIGLENRIVSGVTEALDISVTDAERRMLTEVPTTDIRANDFYMRARESLTHRGKRKAQAAIHMFENAIALDPKFVLAFTGLAEAYALMYSYYDGGKQWLDRIVEVSENALRFDPGLIEAQFSMGLVSFHRKEFDRAREIFVDISKRRPHMYDAYWWLGIISDVTGDFDAALEYYEVAAVIKPYSIEPWLYMNMTQRRKQDVEGAKKSAKRFLEVGLKQLELDPDDTVTLSRFAVVYTLFGEHEKAHAALERILEADTDDGLVLYNCASTYALLGDERQALRCLRMALERGFKNVLEWVKSDPDFGELRSTPEYQQLIKEIVGPPLTSS